MRSIFGIGVLGRYLIQQNLYLMSICLTVGTCIYLLSDVFDRLDDFIKAGLGAETILFYFFVKIPLIVSQLMPAIFLLALVLQLGILTRSKEMLALRAGGVSFAWFIRFFLIYAMFWSLGQLAFSQFLGVFGEYEANRIWKEDVRKKQLDELTITDLWFRDGPFIVLAKEAYPGKSRASDVVVYEFATDNQELIRILTAKKAMIDDNAGGCSTCMNWTPAPLSRSRGSRNSSRSARTSRPTPQWSSRATTRSCHCWNSPGP